MAQAITKTGKPKSKGLPRWLIQCIIALGVVVLGFVGSSMLVKAKKPPQTTQIEAPGALVDVVAVHAKNVPIVIEGFGTVEPRVQVQLVPQVAGKVVKVHPALAAGGFIPANEPVIEIEKADYELAVKRAEASLASARSAVDQAKASIAEASTQLKIEQAEADIAKAEWEADNPNKQADPLLLREPQIRRAKAMVSSAQAQRAAAVASVQQAEAALDEAKLNLQRTRVTMSYDARVLDESVDLGQYVSPGQPVATLYGVEQVEITVMVDDRDLAWFNAPGNGRRTSSVKVSATFAGQQITWPGRLARMGAQVDVRSRLVPVVVEVDRPFDRKADRAPLAPGMFVKVLIEGRPSGDMIAVPRNAVHNGDTTWVKEDGKLRIAKVKVVHSDRTTAYVTEGLSDGDLVITSLLDAITDGMKIRAAGELPSSQTTNADVEPDITEHTEARRHGGS